MKAATLNVCFQLVPCSQADWEGDVYRNFVLDLFYRQSATGFATRYAVTDGVESADLIVILEPNMFKTRAYASLLWSMRAIQAYPARVFTINYDDAPLAFLPGIYAAMPNKRFEAGFTVAGSYLVDSPNQLLKIPVGLADSDPNYLFTFRGAPSSPVRNRLLRGRSVICCDPRVARITLVDGWFNHSDAQKREYVEEILRSKFVLCPRGQGTGSHRLLEVMQLGRVPVIIADDWVEPSGPRWSEFSLRVAESDLFSIPRLLSEREPSFRMMAKKARQAWEEFFSPDMRLSWMLNQLESLEAHRRDVQVDYRRRWTHRSFYRGNLGPLWSRMCKRLGRLWTSLIGK
jgi:Exostosin family